MLEFDPPRSLRFFDQSFARAFSARGRNGSGVNGHGSHREPIGLLDGPAPIDATTGRKRYYSKIPYGRQNGGLDPERISEEQWIAIGEEELRCGLLELDPPRSLRFFDHGLARAFAARGRNSSNGSAVNGHGSHREPIGLLDGPAPIDATTGRKRFYTKIHYGRQNGGSIPSGFPRSSGWRSARRSFAVASTPMSGHRRGGPGA